MLAPAAKVRQSVDKQVMLLEYFNSLLTDCSDMKFIMLLRQLMAALLSIIESLWFVLEAVQAGYINRKIEMEAQIPVVVSKLTNNVRSP